MKDKLPLVKAIETSKALTCSAKGAVLNNLGKVRRLKTSSRQEMLTKASALANTILAADFSHNMESRLTKAFNEGVPSIYDKAADAV